jgi:hypothetical protein
MSITADVAAIETADVPEILEPLVALAPRRDGNRPRQAGRCHFCDAPLPAFTRLRTRRGWDID